MNTKERKASPTGLTPEQEAEYAIERAELYARMAADPTPPPPIKRMVDENGRRLPLPENYLDIQKENMRKMLEDFRAMPDDDPPGAHDAAMRGIDEERRRLGMRTLFDGAYD